MPHIEVLRLPQDDARRARVLAARIAYQISPDTQLGFAFAQGADGLVAQLQGQDQPAFLISPVASANRIGWQRQDIAFAARRRFGHWGVTAKAEFGHSTDRQNTERGGAFENIFAGGKAQRFGAMLDREMAEWDIALGGEWLQERNSFFGGHFHDAFGLKGADTFFLDMNAAWQASPMWRFGMSFRQGWTNANGDQTIVDRAYLQSRAWSIDVERVGFVRNNDRIALRFAQPLRVSGGGLRLNLPVAYDYATQNPIYGLRPISLIPHGREIMGELAWRGALWGGYASTSLFYRHEPGHYARVAADKGVAFRWNSRF
ncbi:hypothetical protein D6851_06440 [Altericroceibacterium spongiae]|uniref:Uncharacterized protein n=1 Tax=Altericroceibacterium spongiae TaxID=2320269 RepID=A0A420ELS3_9SPHN|nr:hypothetical protein [Altericroceibacterium spongiae]RKF21672.1 hypothetical protein D6851_06440 [Altericroceibacterium spongiae]